MNDAGPAYQFKSVTFRGLREGVRFIVLGAVHGNETCGTTAIEQMIREFETGARMINAGSVTFVPVANPLAYAKNHRMGDRNLNRNLYPNPQPRDFEDHVANWLCPLLAQHDVLLDLHSFHTPGQPFALLGPQNNSGPLEPFEFAAEEEAFALCLGVKLFVDGWLETYARGVKNRVDRASTNPTHENSHSLDVKYGVGTTEYIRTQGGWGITLECGQHEDSSAPQVAYQAISNALAHLGLVHAPMPEKVRDYKNLRIVEVVDKLDERDRFAQPWKSFDILKAGDTIGYRHGGQSVISDDDAVILFPNPTALPENEWFYLAKWVKRF